VLQYLEEVRGDILDHVALFQDEAGMEKGPAAPPAA